ncbi:hypothetical protein AB0I39_32040 [Kitasatospora purpeofusca]|uniref:hypothetical protein n=1 Tax=Kitasatospora purpeofusca TaxID=67352 RepID=UPI0033ECCF70
MRFAGQSLATTEKEYNDLSGVAAGTILSRTEELASRSTVVSVDRLAELKEIIAEARPVLESRNTYVHGIWIDNKGIALVRHPMRHSADQPARPAVAPSPSS